MPSNVSVSLPSDLRPAFKGPFGPIYTDTATLISDLSPPVIAVGDIVTWHLERADFRPHLAVIDGRTERESVAEDIESLVTQRPNQLEITNPPGTITEELITALADGINSDTAATILVDGEEDLAAVPAVILAPTGATVVYGQPGKGMVPIDVTDKQKATFRALLGKMDGNTEQILQLLDKLAAK